MNKLPSRVQEAQIAWDNHWPAMSVTFGMQLDHENSVE